MEEVKIRERMFGADRVGGGEVEIGACVFIVDEVVRVEW